MTNTANRAWIYTRIDAPEDAHGALKNQEKELIHYADQMNFAIVGTSSDLGSATGCERPGLIRVTDAAREGSFDILLVKKLSKLSRDAVQRRNLLRQLSELGIIVFSPLEGEINMNSISRQELHIEI